MSKPQIIYEDEDFLAINKPAGLIIHPTKHTIAGHSETLVDWLLKNYPAIKNVGDDPQVRPGIVHRLDKDTSGIMLIPKNQLYFEYLKSLFQRHEIKKQYLAIVWGKVEGQGGLIDKPIGIIAGTLRRSVHSKKMQKNAVTEYKVKRHFSKAGNDMTLLEVYPRTGRTHQIRIHLATLGHPIVGDNLYGKNRPHITPRQLLHAESLEFSPKPGEYMKLSADLPDDFRLFLT